jgi:hypothetical protein
MPKKKLSVPFTDEQKLNNLLAQIAKTEKSLEPENAENVRNNMKPKDGNGDDVEKPICIVCTDQHAAQFCNRLTGPVSGMAWISQAGNISGDKARVARELVGQLQKKDLLKAAIAANPSAPSASTTGASSQAVGSSSADPAATVSSEEGDESGIAMPPSADAKDKKDATEVSEEEKKMAAMQNKEVPLSTQYPLQSGSCDTIEGARSTEMRTNFYKIDVRPGTTLYEYNILDLPVGQNRRKLKKLVDSMIENVDILRKNQGSFATDETSTIISWTKLHTTANSEGIIDTYDVPEGKRSDGTPLSRALRLKYSRDIDLAGLRNYVAHGQEDPNLWDSSVEVNALNILISKSLDASKVVRLGVNKFFVISQDARLSGSLRMMHGYFYTIKALDGGILLNVNFGTSAFYTPQTVGEFLSDDSTFFNESQKRAALNALRVSIEYGRGKTQADQKRDWDDPDGREKSIQGTSGTEPLSDISFKKKDKHEVEQKMYVLDYLEKSKSPTRCAIHRH